MLLKEFIEKLEQIEDKHGNVTVETAQGIEILTEELTLVRDEEDDKKVIAVALNT